MDSTVGLTALQILGPQVPIFNRWQPVHRAVRMYKIWRFLTETRISHPCLLIKRFCATDAPFTGPLVLADFTRPTGSIDIDTLEL